MIIHIKGAFSLVWKLFAVLMVVGVAVGFYVERAVTNTEIISIADVPHYRDMGGSITIQGTVTSVKDNDFVLKDSTGKVELSTCPLWYRRIFLNVGDEITVVGRPLSVHPKHPSCVGVMTVYKIKRGDEEVTLRDNAGKPPWVSSPM